MADCCSLWPSHFLQTNAGTISENSYEIFLSLPPGSLLINMSSFLTRIYLALTVATSGKDQKEPTTGVKRTFQINTAQKKLASKNLSHLDLFFSTLTTKMVLWKYNVLHSLNCSDEIFREGAISFSISEFSLTEIFKSHICNFPCRKWESNLVLLLPLVS